MPDRISNGKQPVLLYFYRLGESSGGAERMICALANALAERDINVQLITWDESQATAFYPLNAKIKWNKLGFKPGLFDKLRRTRALMELIHHVNAALLIGFVMSGDKTIYAAAKLSGIKLIVAERNAPAMYKYRYSWWQRRITFALMHLADIITVQMPGFKQHYPFTLQKRIRVIPNPVTPATCRANPSVPNARGRFTLLSVCRLDAIQKRPKLLIDAFVRLAGTHPEWDLLIVGNGPEEESLSRHILACGLGSRIKIEAPVQDIFQLYSRSHLFGITSLWEGFPNALAEAMSHGLPAVGYVEASGVAELIGAGGWLAEGLHSVDTLADALDQGMRNSAERELRGNKAATRIAAYPPEAQLKQWSALIQSLMHESSNA